MLAAGPADFQPAGQEARRRAALTHGEGRRRIGIFTGSQVVEAGHHALPVIANSMAIARQDHDDIARAKFEGFSRYTRDMSGTLQERVEINRIIVGNAESA